MHSDIAAMPESVAHVERSELLSESDLAPVIVVGAGPSGLRCVEELLRHQLKRPVWLFGEERWEPYNRVRLSSLLAGDIRLSDIDLRLSARSMSRVVHVSQCRVVAIDPALRQITDQYGRRHSYHKLVLALGSSAYIPSVPGVQLKGVYSLRSLSDTEALLARRARVRKLLVIGGGLLGLEAAKAMARDGTEVEVIQQASHVMNRQLDQRGGERVSDYLRLLGIRVRLGSGLAEIRGDTEVSSILLRNGTEIPCDSVLLAAGIVPNVELARSAWIKVGRGIRVDDAMLTSDPDIYAVGECAEHNGHVYGLVAPGLEQAAVAAAHICDEGALYRGSMMASQLKVAGLAVTSIGSWEQLEGQTRVNELVFSDQQHYRKIIMRDGRLLAVIAVGEWQEKNRLLEAVTTQRYLWPWQRLAFRRTGLLWKQEESRQVSEWPADALVCQCMAVPRGTLSSTIDGGATTIEALAACTGASTVCGSCKPLLAELIGAPRKADPIKAGPSHTAWGIAALILTTLLTVAPAIGVKDSVQNLWPPDFLWRDSLYKQISGFTLLGLVLVGLALSLRKRVRFFSVGKGARGAFDYWRLAHVILGVLALFALLIHTGIALGHNLNRWLMMDFLAAAALGALTTYVIAWQHRMGRQLGERVRAWMYWLHIVVLWPLPVLLGLHILSVYYF
ncbi:FAD-dependent oxidoreductase [Hahella ganghwensis]|uniref:FAD-dependent oxidoreductase n=1 Tax=Hahella ganghwensis TaxID=286420 RepID=UPI00039F5743|nr:FAD-dependent oxidoreductase [Hahella ganghwensis]